MSTTQQAHLEGDGNIFVQVVGNDNAVNVQGLPHLELTNYPSRRRLARTELELLDPFRRAIELAGRDTELKTLWDWLHDEPSIAARVVTGGAGAGKTRLAVELVERLRLERPGQWHAGFVTGRELLRFAGAGSLSGWGWRKPTLVLVDYAAALVAPINDWLHDLAENHHANGRPLRLLLLEREASPEQGWLRALLDDSWSGQGVRELLNPLEPLRLGAISAIPSRAILEATLAKASALLKAPAPILPDPGTNPVLDRHLAQPLWTEPLHLMMAALVAVGSKLPLVEVLSLSRTDLAFRLAGHELGRLRRFAGDEGSAKATLLAFGGVAATLCGGLDRNELIEVLGEAKARLHLACPDGEAGQADLLEDALPRAGSGIAPILPDMIGEAALLSAYDSRGKARLDTEWVLQLAQKHSGTVVVAVIRTIQDFAATDETPLSWIDGLIQSGCADSPTLLSEIEDCLPQETLALRERAVKVTELLPHRLDAVIAGYPTVPEQVMAEKARLLSELGRRLSDIGQPEAALAKSQEAVRLFAELDRKTPNVHLPNLGAALNNLANRQNEMGRQKEALANAGRAMGIHKRLAAACPAAFEQGLAMSANNMAALLSAAGRHPAACAKATEAVRIYRQLATARPDSFLPLQAKSLSNLALRMSELGRSEEALAAADEAVQTYRQLAALRPDSFLPGLAGSLMNLALRLGEMGRRPDAVSRAEEAVEMFWELKRAWPVAFEKAATTSVRILATMLCDLGRFAEAKPKCEDAVRLHRHFAVGAPDEILPGLASALYILAACLNALGMRDEALANAAEAVEAFERLSASQPDAFLSELGKARNLIAKITWELGHPAEALAHAHKAIQVFERLEVMRPSVFLPDLGIAFSNIANFMGELGQWQEALCRAERAVGILRPLADARPDAFLGDLAMALMTLAGTLATLGRQPDALPKMEEAVGIYRRLALQGPEAVSPTLATALANLAGMLNALGRMEEALPKVEEAVAIAGPLAASKPGVYAPHKARALGTRGETLWRLNRTTEAVESFREGIATLEGSFRQLPLAHAPLMGALCSEYLKAVAACGAQPDTELLGPIVVILRQLRQTSKPE